MLRMSCVLAALTSLVVTAAPARADLSFTNPAVDVGEVRSGLPLRQSFAFVNRGPGTVEITDLRTSCGCLKPTLAKRTYDPGDSGELTLEVHTLSQPAGEHTWHLQVAYRVGREAGAADLSVTGRVVTEVAVQPASLTIVTERGASHEITLTDLRDKPLSVTGVRTSSPHLKGEVRQTTTDGAGHRVVQVALSLAAGCPEGRFEETVALLTDDPDYRELTISVVVDKRPKRNVTAAPAAVSLTAARGQAVPSRIVLLRPTGTGAVAVERVESDDPSIVCTWAAGPDDCATLKVSIDRTKMPADGLRSAVRVHISKPVAETLTVPVTVQAEGRGAW
jgi:hypothetical protein